MDALSSAAGAVSLAEGVIRDTTGAQVITKTLDRMNTVPTLSGSAIDSGYQFRKDVLSAAGVGNALNVEA